MKQSKRYKRIATGIATTAAVVTIGAGMMTPTIVHAADGTLSHQHSSTQRKAPAWRVGLRAAEAKALGMSVDEFKEARKTKKLDQLVKDAGLTFTQFSQKVKDELTATWKADSVSDKEIAARLAKLDKHQNRREHRWEKKN
jgi:hypothetical protein